MSGTYPGAEQPRSLGNRYELGAVLGRGGMAEVFMARDTRLGRTVAVKTLRADLSRDPTFQARFRREAQSAASLNHPAIVAIYDTGEDFENGVSVPYIVMEYADGSTLRDLLHSGRRLLPERALEITAGVLQALDYSHRNGIIHRDIKPANIMLTRSGTVKVMDFGIARAMADNGMTMTQTAAVIGTAQYLSPEQAKGETVDARSDLYSTGCLMYELLTGRPPFVGDSPVAVAYQHVREEPLPPSSYDPEVTPVIDAVVLKSLAKTADGRYQSAAEMRADIERVLDGRPTEAQTEVLGAANMPTQRLDPRAVGAAAMGAGAVGQTRAMPPVQDAGYQQQPARRGYDDDDYDGGRAPAGPPRRPDSRRPPEPEPKSGKTGYVILGVAAVAAVIAAVLLFNTILKPGGASNNKAVPDLTGKNLDQAKALIAQNPGFSLVGLGADCSTEEAKHLTPQGTISEQKPGPGTYQAPGPITYCLSSGPVTGSVPDVATLNGMTEPQLKAALTAAKFPNVSAVIPSHQNDPKVPKDHIIDVRDLATNQSLAGKKGIKVDEVQLTWIVSDGQKQIQVPDVSGLNSQDAVNQLRGQGFTKVTPVVDPQGNPNNLAQGTVTRLGNVTVGQMYNSDQPITVFFAPPPVAPPVNTCDQDPTACQTTPSGQPSNPSSTGTQPGGPGGIIFPPTSTSSKHG
jgi:beta-lactam-binding protein with PASTA domain/predicted Ser/Thr protein kinase